MSPPFVLGEGEVYIGRGNGTLPRPPWHNPFKVAEGGRDAAVESFRRLLRTVPMRFEGLWQGITDKTLRCHCKPDQRCHGDAIIEQWYSAVPTTEVQILRYSDRAPAGEPRTIELPGKSVPYHDGGGLTALGRWPWRGGGTRPCRASGKG